MTPWSHRRFGCTGVRLPLPGRWQLELWLAPRGVVIPAHTHPHIQSRLIFLGGCMRWQRGSVFRTFDWRHIGRSFAVAADVVHGAVTLGRFGLFANLERWVGPKSSAAVDLEIAR